jgi:hypothetical protein
MSGPIAWNPAVASSSSCDARRETLVELATAGFQAIGPDMALPDTIEPETVYEVTMIAAPIFDSDGACAFNLCLGPFEAPLSGQAILNHADALLATCVAVMRDDRARR